VIPQRGGFTTPDGGSELFSVEPTAEGYKLPWASRSRRPHQREVWENLPRLYWYYPVKKKKDLATVVATHPTDKDESNSKMPLM
jgi:hypothetical protein